jgi:vancomycin resistance protein YoaR
MKAAHKQRTAQRTKIGAALAGLVALALFLAAFFIINLDIIYPGVSIEGIDVSVKDRQEAVRLMQKRMGPLLAGQKLVVTYNSDAWEVGMEQIGGSYDYIRAVNEAYEAGKEGNPIERVLEILRLRREGKNIPLRFRYDALALRAFIEGVNRVIATPPVDASITRKGGEFEVQPGRAGVGVDIEAALLQIDADLSGRDFSPKALPLVTVQPELTEKMLESINTVWGMYSTSFNTGAEGRSENIKVAAGSIEGILLKPGEEFSFNGATGLRTEENGYKEAPVIVGGELEPGIGGGVCQVSSTLYNAVLLANLEISERHNHTIPSTYIPMGLDATVVDRYLDFKFRNNTDGYLYLACWVDKGKVHAAVFGGKREEDIQVKLRTEVLEVIEEETDIVIDRTLSPGQQVVEKEGRKGYRIKTYRQVIRDGRPEAEEVLSVDFYKPEKGLIRKGPDKGQ